jgi:hypothetical protein
MCRNMEVDHDAASRRPRERSLSLSTASGFTRTERRALP